MAALPLKLRVGIREYWDKEDGKLQQNIRALKETLGLDVVIQPEWQLLLAEFDTINPDKAQFAAAVAGCVSVWCRAIKELLDDDANAEWAETLVDRLTDTYRSLRLFIEVSPNEAVTTSWSKERGGFVLGLSRARDVLPVEFFPVFQRDLLACFEQKTASAPSQAGGSAAGAPPANDWADVEVDKASGKVNVVERPAAKVDFMPSADSLPRPDELFLKPPYHLIVYAPMDNMIEVEASHSPTLQLLADYLKRWARVNHGDSRSPTAAEVKLSPSAFGLGVMTNRLVISTESRLADQFAISPTIILSFVESILGYQRTYGDGRSWTYSRENEFRTL